MSKTIKQIADELEIDKQKVYRYIKKNNIIEAHQKNGVMYYDEAAETLIKRAFTVDTASSESHQNHINDTVNDVLISMLQKELEIKNKQIEELTAIVKQQAETINANSHNQLAETLIEGKQQLISSGEPEKEKPPKRSWWSRLFGSDEDNDYKGINVEVPEPEQEQEKECEDTKPEFQVVGGVK